MHFHYVVKSLWPAQKGTCKSSKKGGWTYSLLDSVPEMYSISWWKPRGLFHPIPHLGIWTTFCLSVEVIVCGHMTNSSRARCGARSADSRQASFLLFFKPVGTCCPHAQCPSAHLGPAGLLTLSKDVQGCMLGLAIEELWEFASPGKCPQYSGGVIPTRTS